MEKDKLIRSLTPEDKNIGAHRRSNLPLQLTSFIGRADEIREIRRLLQSSRLLTLCGAGGCGKSRLALQVAQMMIEGDLASQGAFSPQSQDGNPQFKDGIWLVELAPLSEPEMVDQAVAYTFGIREALGGSFIEAVINFLHAKAALLILDNCEHLIAACAHFVETLLRACPALQILVTSREPLRIGGEIAWTVPPLTLPGLGEPSPGQEDAVDALLGYEAIRLFVERATVSAPTFTLTAHNSAAILQICRRLDGLPLAIELAAARANVLAVEQIAERLGKSLHLLKTGSRTAPARHQNLQAAIEWSYHLLAEKERILFNRLSIFAGSFTLEAVEAICAGSAFPPNLFQLGFDYSLGGELAMAEILTLLAQLVEKSLLTVEPAQAGVARYHLLETIRHYSWEQLQAVGEVDSLRARHLAFFLHFAQAADAKLRGPEQVAWLQRLDVEHDNLRAALTWSLQKYGGMKVSLHTLLGFRLIGALAWFWQIKSYFGEGRNWCERALALDGSEEHSSKEHRAATAKVLQTAGICADMQGDFARARIWLEQSLAIWRAVDEPWEIAFTLRWLAAVASVPGDQESAHPLAEASVALFRQLGDRWGVAFARYVLACVVREKGDSVTARHLFEETLVSFRAGGDAYMITETLSRLAGIAYNQEDYTAVQSLLEEALAGEQSLDNRFSRLAAYLKLADIARLQGEIERALAIAAQNLTLAHEIGAQWFVAEAYQQLGFITLDHGGTLQAMSHFRAALELSWVVDTASNVMSLVGVVVVAIHQGQWQRAARVWGALATIKETLPRPLLPVQAADYERTLAQMHARRAEPALAVAWAEGQAMTLEEAIAYALAPAPAYPAPATPGLPAANLEARAEVELGVEAEAVPELRFFALGPARLYRGEHLVTAAEWTYGKSKEILFYLLCHPPQTKEQIGLVFWPDASPAQLRNSFGVALYHLRRALGGPHWIVFENDRYALNRTLSYSFDLERFEAHLRQARRLQGQAPTLAIVQFEQAIALVQGDFLEDSNADWSLSRRRQVHAQYIEALLTLGELLFAGEEYARAAAVYRQAIAGDSFTEAAHHALIRCYIRQGERGQALRHYQQLVHVMHAELGLPPAAETTALIERLRRGEEI